MLRVGTIGMVRSMWSTIEKCVVHAVGRKAAEAAAVGTGDQQARHAAAMAQVLAVVEGLEEELHAAETACHNAERDSHTSGRSAKVCPLSAHLRLWHHHITALLLWQTRNAASETHACQRCRFASAVATYLAASSVVSTLRVAMKSCLVLLGCMVGQSEWWSHRTSCHQYEPSAALRA